MKLTIVKIEWLDARAEAGWASPESKDENLPVVTIGILGKKTANSQIVYSTYDPQDNHFADKNMIPLKMITNVTILREEEL